MNVVYKINRSFDENIWILCATFNSYRVHLTRAGNWYISYLRNISPVPINSEKFMPQHEIFGMPKSTHSTRRDSSVCHAIASSRQPSMGSKAARIHPRYVSTELQNTVWYNYYTVCFLRNIYNSYLRGRGGGGVMVWFDLYPATVITVLCVIRWYYGLGDT